MPQYDRQYMMPSPLITFGEGFANELQEMNYKEFLDSLASVYSSQLIRRLVPKS